MFDDGCGLRDGKRSSVTNASSTNGEPNDALAAVLPKGVAGSTLAGFLASSISSAHAARPACWGLTVRKSLVRLNVGTPEALSFSTEHLHVCVLVGSMPATLLERDDVYRIEAEGREGEDVYRSVPGSRLLGLADLSSRPMKTFLELVQQSQLSFVRAASISTPNPMTKRSHTAECIDELAVLTNRSLPQPGYWSRTEAGSPKTK